MCGFLQAAQRAYHGDWQAPCGNHAGADFFGGYCFLNNAALAAQALLI